MQWFAIGLIPIYRPISVDMWRAFDIRASMGSPDGDTLDLDRLVHACIHGGPISGDVLQCPPIFAFSIGKTIFRRPEGVPECALGNTILSSPLPSLPLFSQQLSFIFQQLPLLLQPACLAQWGVVEEESHDDEKDDDPDDGNDDDPDSAAGSFVGCGGGSGGCIG